MTTEILTPSIPNLQSGEPQNEQETVTSQPLKTVGIRANYGGLKYTAAWWEWHRTQRAYDGGTR